LNDVIAEPRRTHPVVRLNFFVRMVGCPIAVLVTVSSRLGAGAEVSLMFAIALGLYGLAWPVANLLVGRSRKDQKRYEHRAMLFDSAVAGSMIAGSMFQPLPAVALAASFSSVLASVGGVRLLVWGMLALVTGIVGTGALITDFEVAGATSTSAALSSAALLIVFQTFLGLQTFRTARKFIRSRRQIAEQSDEIRVQNDALMHAREEALQAAKAKSVFLATMSHEIRTPLNGVLGMTRLLEETRLDEEQQDLLRTIQVSGNTLLRVINDVLDFSRIESGKIELEEEPYSLRGVIEEALEIVSERARGNAVELICDEGGDIPDTILGDITRMRQVVTNLVGNAVKFTEHGEVLVSVRRVATADGDEDAALIVVSDTGIGIPADRLDQLFTPFTQADASTTRRFGGTGLGLAITRNIIEQMDGRIEVESEVGVGTRVIVTLPMRVVPGGEHERTVIPDLRPGQRILIVDDNETNRRVLIGQLTRWGFEVDDADGADAALTLLRSDASYDLAILDLHMPDVDGLMLAKSIRDLPSRAELPLILLSSSMVQDQSKAKDLFAARLLKPARQSRLFDATLSALQLAPQRKAADPVRSEDRMADRAPMAILVVDDNEINRKVAGLAFKRLGYEVEFAEDGSEAVDCVKGRALGHTAGPVFDIVFMDVHMPRMDGLEATRHIRRAADEDPHRSWPRIVAITADAMHEERETCLTSGMDDYLTKPLDFDALRRVLEETAAGLSLPTRTEDEGTPARESDSVYVDWGRIDELRRYDGPDGTIVRDALSAFVAQTESSLVELREAVSSGDDQVVRSAAHRLKGSAANIGAQEIASISGRLEAAARAGDLSDAEREIDSLSLAVDETLVQFETRS
jgi:signal transduction histidine kinase/DNA-binding response OmpR family regulator/HPt (histidine-containing phosphotransfer) domain-containing protein